MKYLSLLSFIFVLFAGCIAHKTLESASASVSLPPSSSVETTASVLTLTGTYESKQGVMTPLSCYCGNGGYLTTSDEKQIAICFEGNNDEIRCKKLRVTGFYKTKKNKPEPTSPCPQGEMTYFKVESFECLVYLKD